MKKVLIGILAIIMVLGLVGCNNANTSDKNTNNDSVYEESNKTETDDSSKTEISKKEVNGIAEEAAMSQVLKYMSMGNKFSQYDIYATKYEIEKIDTTEDYKGYESMVYGTLYLYDDYGNFKDTADFKSEVEIDKYGNAKGYFPTIYLH